MIEPIEALEKLRQQVRDGIDTSIDEIHIEPVLDYIEFLKNENERLKQDQHNADLEKLMKNRFEELHD